MIDLAGSATLNPTRWRRPTPLQAAMVTGELKAVEPVDFYLARSPLAPEATPPI